MSLPNAYRACAIDHFSACLSRMGGHIHGMHPRLRSDAMEAECSMDGAAGSQDTGPDGQADAGGTARGAEGRTQPSDAELARDWISLWQSELNALALDPETMRSWRSAMQAWSGIATWFLQAMPKAPPAPPDDTQKRRSGPKSTARPASPAAAPDAGDNEIVRLMQHVAQLERRLANLERRGSSGPAIDPKRRRSRKT
jgi:hypothetical protein